MTKTYLAVIWAGKWQSALTLTLRRPINGFAKKVIARAYELQFINSGQLHQLAAIIDRSLYPEYYESPWVDEKGDSAP
jgi:hypothetical protein